MTVGYDEVGRLGWSSANRWSGPGELSTPRVTASGTSGIWLRPTSNTPAAALIQISASHVTSGIATASHVVTRLRGGRGARFKATQRPVRTVITIAGRTTAIKIP